MASRRITAEEQAAIKDKTGSDLAERGTASALPDISEANKQENRRVVLKLAGALGD